MNANKIELLLENVVAKLGELAHTLKAGQATTPEPTAKETLPELLTAEQAWGFCSLSKSAWYKGRSSGKIPPPVRIGGALRWQRDELRDWVRSGCPPLPAWIWETRKKSGK